MIELTQITIYPVKSCRGMTLTRANLTPYGLKDDRRWMIVDSQGAFRSQRTLPKMALIEPSVSRDELILTAPACEAIEVPLLQKRAAARTVRIWDDTCAAQDCGDEAAKWLSTFLDIDCRLVTMGDTYERSVGTAYSRLHDQVSFADAFPLLLISSGSLRDLNERLDQPIPMNRFRPNLVVSGCDPYAEDRWKRISMNGMTFTVSKPCTRCTVPTVDQMKGTSSDEPLATLSTYRKGNTNAVFFGQNLLNEQKSGQVVQGAQVSVVE